MNLIDQAKTIMEGCRKKEINILFNKPDNVSFCGKKGFLCDICKAKASQMLIDRIDEKEFLEELKRDYPLYKYPETDEEVGMINLNEMYHDDFDSRLKEINSAIEILNSQESKRKGKGNAYPNLAEQVETPDTRKGSEGEMKLKIKGNTYNVDGEFMKMYQKMSKKKKDKFDNLVKERADMVDEQIFLHICSAQDIIDYVGKKK